MLMLQKMHEYMVLQGEDGPPPAVVNAVDFDGSNDYLNRGGALSVQGNQSTGILSFWTRLDSVAASACFITNAIGNNIYVTHNTSKFKFDLFSSGGGASFNFESIATYSSGAAWLHVLAAWNTNFSAGNKIAQLYINDTLQTSITSDGASAFDVGMGSAIDWSIGASGGGSLKLNGCLSEFYFAPGQFLDFSIAANRRKFITAGGKPVNLGGGLSPTGTSPSIYLNGPAASFGTNSGNGGNFTITGTLDPASTRPSD